MTKRTVALVVYIPDVAEDESLDSLRQNTATILADYGEEALLDTFNFNKFTYLEVGDTIPSEDGATETR